MQAMEIPHLFEYQLFSLLKTYWNTTGATSGAEAAYHSEHLSSPPAIVGFVLLNL